MMTAIEREDCDMSSVAMILAAAALAGAPPVDLKPSPSPHVLTAAAASERACGPQLDPQFVHYVPPAPSSGDDGLFRLISSPEPKANQPDLNLDRMGRRNGCARALFTGY
jgi:hypothetical protein